MNVLPAMVSVPDRTSPGFGLTLKLTDPFPDPDPPPVTVMKLALLAAVHPHVVLDAVTATVPLPPVASKAWLSGEIVKVHGAAAWLTVNV